MYKKNKLSSAIFSIVAAAAAGAPGIGVAQGADGEYEEIEEVVVSGIRASMERAMDIKRDAGGVVDAISAEDIGKFPDTNLAESLQRITGVSIDRSGGEGQLITVRGFGPQFNTVLVNGRQMATENRGREFSFDTLASELVSGIEVYKTSSATMQSGGVGSTVNVRTARPFDFNGYKVAGSIKGLYDTNSEESTPQFSGLYSNTYAEDTIGVLVSVSHQERETRLDAAQTDGWLLNVGIPEDEFVNGPRPENVFSARNHDRKVTFEERTRTGGSLVLQYRPSQAWEFTFDALYSDFDVETDAKSYGHWFTAPNLENVTVDGNGTVIDMFQRAGHATDFHSKKFDRLTETSSVGLAAAWHVNDSLKLSFDASFSSAEKAANNGGGNQLSLIGYLNQSRFTVHPNQVLPESSEFENADPTRVNAEGVVTGVSDYLDPANGRSHVMLRRGWEVDDSIDQFRVDGEWDEGRDSGLIKAKFGLMFAAQEKKNTRWDNESLGQHCAYCGYFDGPDVPDEFQFVFDAGSDFLDGISGGDNMPARWMTHDGEQLFAWLEQQPDFAARTAAANLDAVRRDNSIVVEEDTLAGYLELEFAGEIAAMPLTARTGVRLESTDVTVRGTESTLIGLTILDQTELSQQFGPPAPISADADYNSLLPNMDVKLDLNENLVVRLAASRTLTRPTVDNMSPSINITTTRQGGNLAASSGNPELEPFESDNVDLSLEYYYGDASYVSIGYFQKDVENFIISSASEVPFDGVTDPSTGDDPGAPDANDTTAVFTITAPSNGESAEVDGIELAFQHTFAETGFGVIANATYVDSNAELDVNDVTQTFALTGLSDSLNLVGFYEKGPFQIRLAWNWRDEFLQSLVQGTISSEPTFVDEYEQWDISGSYDINDNISVFFEGINLTDEIVTKHGRFDNHFLLATDSGTRWALGVRANF